jgi:RNA polymerase sigma-70 factor (ECF subfamily)
MTPAAATAACKASAVAYRLWAMPSHPPPSSTADRDLVARAAAGDERAIAGLYDRYGQVLYAVAYRIVGERADAEEVVLDAFAQAWRDAPRFEAARGSVAGWLTMIARSRALDLVRARSRRDRITTTAASARPDAPLAMGERRPDPAAGVDHAERRREVRQALDALSAPQRQAIELAYYEGLSQSEIAERLQEPLGTIKTRIRLGMQKLREALRPFYFEPGP